MPHAEPFLRDLAVVLIVAAFTTVICQRLRLPVVVGYIVAGIITGPGTPPALVTDTTWIRTLAELGVVLLMYVIGLEFSLRRLARLLPITGPAAVVETMRRVICDASLKNAHPSGRSCSLLTATRSPGAADTETTSDR